MKQLCAGLLLLGAAALGSGREPAFAQDFAAILAAPDRPDAERELDPVRKPAEVLKFYGVKPGDKVADLMAARGYYTVILARAVGGGGVVYSVVPSARKELTERLKSPDYAHVKIVEAKMDAFELPANTLDFALIHLNYHDLDPATRMGMNKKVYAALKPGGVYGVVDHSAKEGSGEEVTKSLHRIDKAVVIEEVTQAGFASTKEGNVLRNPEDTFDFSTTKVRGKSDRFVLRFEKPR
ncbi:MAG TPA: methyltransferase domain-containing protein [Candidatus Acidoferrales bacterium]|nr:methyltransferase domain-containing protein [Candidatus Acidoferrales bacterium]